MPTFWIALGLSLLGGLGGLLIASGVLLIHDPLRAKLIPWLVSYAVGALLGISMLGLLPESLTSLPAARVFATLLGGIMLFFILEKLVLWRHCHTHDCEVHESSVASVMIGDTFHNFVDGAVIGAAVLTSVPLGVSTAISTTFPAASRENRMRAAGTNWSVNSSARVGSYSGSLMSTPRTQ